MNPVQIAKWDVFMGPCAKCIIYIVYAVKPKPYPNWSKTTQAPIVHIDWGCMMAM